MAAYRCLYNHELLILFTSQSPYQSYREDVGAAQATGFVTELAGTQVDALMCCPQAWMTPLWPSVVDPKWQDEAPAQVEPPAEAERTYFEKAYWRIRRALLAGYDPVAISLAAARQVGLGFFISYRMNEIHYVRYAQCPTHSRFWREHPEWRLHTGPSGAPLNYLVPEVRAHLLALLTELAERYDLDGLELDFMRHPTLVPAGARGRGHSRPHRLCARGARPARPRRRRPGATAAAGGARAPQPGAGPGGGDGRGGLGPRAACRHGQRLTALPPRAGGRHRRLQGRSAPCPRLWRDALQHAFGRHARGLPQQHQPPPDSLRFYAVPLAALRPGVNRIAITNRTVGEYALGQVTLTGLELALYLQPQP